MAKTKLHEGVTLIEVADPLLLTEMENDPVIRPFLGERLSDRCVAVMSQGLVEVQRRLQALNHMPTLINGQPSLRESDQAV